MREPLEAERSAHSTLQRFVSAISSRDTELLQSGFALCPEVIDEIYEVVEGSYDHGVQLSVSSIEEAAITLPGRRPLIEFYSMNDGTLAAECVLLADGQASEAVLHAEFTWQGDQCHLRYRYIGS